MWDKAWCFPYIRLKYNLLLGIFREKKQVRIHMIQTMAIKNKPTRSFMWNT